MPIRYINKLIKETLDDIKTLETWCVDECVRMDNNFECSKTCKLGQTRKTLYKELDNYQTMKRRKLAQYIVCGIILVCTLLGASQFFI